MLIKNRIVGYNSGEKITERQVLNFFKFGCTDDRHVSREEEAAYESCDPCFQQFTSFYSETYIF
jgi:hypothetical protein